MTYPLIIGGKNSGRLSTGQDGLYTVLEAECPESCEGIVRLWLHGGGECRYIGVMQPWSGGLYLRRRLSRSEWAQFPKNIEYASDTGENEASPSGQKKTEAPPESGFAPCPAPLSGKSGELLWMKRADGTLTAFDGSGSLVAIPTELRGRADGTVIRRIEGRDYMIFRY